MNNWYDDLLTKEEAPKSTNWYDQILEGKPQEPPTTGWYDEISAEPKVAEKKPDLGWGETAKEMLKPSSAAEAVAHLGWGMATWVPSKISGLGQIGLQKITNRVLEDAIKDEKISSEKRELLRQKGAYSPEKIREMAERSEALWQILPPPESKEAKYVLEKVGKGLDKILTPFRIADEYYSKKGYPNLGYAFRFAGELLFFKAAHGLGVKSTAKLKKLRKKVIEKAPAAEIKEPLDAVLDEMKIEKEGITPKADTLKGVTKSQKMRAHKIAKEKGFTDIERQDLAERVTGQRSMMEMNRESAREFIDVLKRGKEEVVELDLKEITHEWTCKEDAPELATVVREAIELKPSNSVQMENALNEILTRRKIGIPEEAVTEFTEMFKNPKFVEEIMELMERKVKDAGRIREEAREAGEEVRIEREEERPVRVRDIEKDRLEAREREAKEEIVELEIKPEIEEPPLRSDLSEKVRYEGIQDDIVKSPTGELIEEPAYYVYTDLKTESTFMVPLKADLNKAVAKRLVEMEKAFKKPEVEPPSEAVISITDKLERKQLDELTKRVEGAFEDPDIIRHPDVVRLKSLLDTSTKFLDELKKEKVPDLKKIRTVEEQVNDMVVALDKAIEDFYEGREVQLKRDIESDPYLAAKSKRILEQEKIEITTSGKYKNETDVKKLIKERADLIRKMEVTDNFDIADRALKNLAMVEARFIELTKEGKELRPSEAVKTLISDDIRTAEDMGLYADIKEMIGKDKKVGEIMKELKQKAYYEEDLKDFGYTEKDIRESIRAIKAETGDEAAIKQIQSVLKVEKKKVEKVTEIEERVPPEDKVAEEIPTVKEGMEDLYSWYVTAKQRKGKLSQEWIEDTAVFKKGKRSIKEIIEYLENKDIEITGKSLKPSKEEPITASKEIDEARLRWEQEQVPIKNEEGRILKSKVFAMKRMKELGQTGELVKNPKGEGWLLKRERPSAEERRAEEKEWEDVLREEELGEIGEEGFGERVDVEVDTIFDPFGSERGATPLFGDIVKKIKGLRLKFRGFLDKNVLERKAEQGTFNISDKERLIKFFSREITESGKLKDTKYSKNIKKFEDQYIVVTDNDMHILGSTNIGETLANINHIDFDILKYSFDNLLKDKNTLQSIIKKEFKEGLIDKSEYDKARTMLGLVRDSEKVLRERVDVDIDHLWGERGAITFRRETVKKLKNLIKTGTYTRNRVIKELRERGATDEDILKVFPDASVRILNEGVESKWWKKGQDPLELLPRRTLPNKLKAPAITRGEAHMMVTMKDMPARLTAEHLSWENSIRTFEKLPPETKETFYRSVKEGESLAFDRLHDVLKRSKKIRHSIGYTSHKRIGIHSIAQQPDGIAVLAQQGITKIPKLKPKELKAYEDLRVIYDEFFTFVNKARIAAGEKPFPPIKNYATWIQDMTYLSKTEGIGLFSNWRTIESKMAEIKRVPSFRFAKFRAGPERPRKLNLNPFTVLDTYSKIATNYIEMAPRLAKLNELTMERFGMKQSAPHAYNFLQHWLNYQAGKIPAWDIAHPTTRWAMRTLNSNIVFSLLAFNVRSALIQPAALASSYTMLGSYYTGVGLSHVMSPAKWKMAGKKSKIINTRTPEVAIYEAMEASGKFPSMFKKKVAEVGMMPLTVLDSVAARITLLGAYAKGRQKLKLSEEAAWNYADDVVTRTQASAARSDVAPIQRTQLGKTITCLQTFVINHWGFLTKDVLGIRNVDINNATTVKRVLKFVLATTAVNAFYEDILGLNSPNPTPIRAYREAFEETGESKEAFVRGVKEIAEYIPLWGGRLRYGSELGGPVISEALKLIEKGDIGALTKLIGIPGSNQFFKMVRAYERSGTSADIVLGRYVEPPKSLTAPIGGGRRTDLLAPIGED